MSEKGAPYSFTNLDFYQQARALAVDAFNLARKLPKDDATRVVSRQLVAAVTSIRANIAEGHGRYSRAAYRNHLSIARGSAAETQDWVDLLHSVGLLSEAEKRDITERCDRIIASLTRAMISLGDAGATPRLREDAASYVLGAPPDGNYYDEETDAPMLPCSHAPGGPE